MSVHHKPLGSTGLQVPPVVFGSTCLGNLFVAMSDDDKAQLMREWFAKMPKPVAIDSAGKYGAGMALEVIGRELSAMGIDQDDVVLSNKLAWRRVPLTDAQPTFEPGVWVDLKHDAVQDISYDGILRCHEDGCRMLGSYVPQLISVHDPDEYLAAATDSEDRNRRLDDIVQAYRALTELKAEGQVAGVGVGAKDWKSIRELDQYCKFDWVMMANSLTIMNHPDELLEFVDSLGQRGIALINSAVTHGGFLVGGQFFDYRELDENDVSDNARLDWRRRFTQVCRSHGVTPYQVAVEFGRSHPAVTSIALSTSRVDRVGEMISMVDAQSPVELWSELRDLGMVTATFVGN